MPPGADPETFLVNIGQALLSFLLSLFSSLVSPFIRGIFGPPGDDDEGDSPEFL